MTLRSLIEDLANSPRPPREKAVEITLSTATFHRLPEALRRFLMERHAGHRPTWETQTFVLWDADHAEFLRRMEG